MESSRTCLITTPEPFYSHAPSDIVEAPTIDIFMLDEYESIIESYGLLILHVWENMHS